jgi:hypothetical protein
MQPIVAQSQPLEPITEQTPKSDSPTSSKGKGLLRRILRHLPLPLLSSFMSKMKKTQTKNPL